MKKRNSRKTAVIAMRLMWMGLSFVFRLYMVDLLFVFTNLIMPPLQNSSAA